MRPSMYAAVSFVPVCFGAFTAGRPAALSQAHHHQQVAVIALRRCKAVNVGSGTVDQAATTATGNYTFADLPFFNTKFRCPFQVQKVRAAETLLCRWRKRCELT